MRTTSHALLASIVATLLAAGIVATPASAATDAQQGARLLQRVQAGTADCSSLTAGDFDRIGDYVMERMLGSGATHDAMDRQMTLMMGARGETRAHVYMGERFGGCATGNPPAAFGAMMGMVGAGMMGSAYGSGGTTSMMGSGSRGSGGMMGSGYGNPSWAGSDDGWTTGDTVMVALMVLLIAATFAALAVWRPWKRRATPLEVLQARYARGEIDQQDFERRRQALGGTA